MANNYQWYNNGKYNKKIYEGEEIPEGFVHGFLRFKHKKANHIIEKGEKYKMRRLSQRETIVIRKLNIRKKLKLIEDYARRNMTVDEIYSIVKYNDEYVSLNEGLLSIINEEVLIAQFLLFPKFVNTIADSLKELYKKDTLLQNRMSYENYLIEKIKSSPYESSVFFSTP